MFQLEQNTSTLNIKKVLQKLINQRSDKENVLVTLSLQKNISIKQQISALNTANPQATKPTNMF